MNNKNYPKSIEGIAACANDRCLSHRHCLRWKIHNCFPEREIGGFAPSQNAQKCRHYKAGFVFN